MVENIEDIIAERHIELEAMTDEQITAEFVENFGEPEPVGRYEMIDRLLSTLQRAMGVHG
jgi:hypothetical protein